VRRPRVSVFIPSFNGGSILAEAVRGIVAQSTPAHTVVVDNGSTDGSISEVRREFPDVAVLELPSNLGFGRALNRAVAKYPADFLIFTNDDARHERRFVEALLEEAGTGHPGRTVAGVLLKDDDPGLVDSAGVVVDSTLLAFDYLHGSPRDRVSAAPPPLGPTGAAALVPLEAFSTIGGFDERMFAYLEDVDLALRLHATGVECRLAPEACAVHAHSSTLGSGSRRKNYLMGWSRGYMLRRYGVLDQPGRAVRALVTEAAICAGQVAIDHNASGIGGRIAGWRAARHLPPRPIPGGAVTQISLAAALRRRAARRRVLEPLTGAR
jgi:N-acetylglucosaminyl-diphospho-decaprenol L-rhamnosyltransferase